jgi:hypothetical protein
VAPVDRFGPRRARRLWHPEPSERANVREDSPDCHRADPRGEREGLVAGVDHVEPRWPKVGERRAHRRREARRRRALEFESDPDASAHDQEIDLGSCVRRPEVALLGLDTEPRVGAGPVFTGGTDVAVLRFGQLAVAADAIYLVDPGTGDRTQPSAPLGRPRLASPEPESLVLLALALGAVAVARRR